MGLLRKSSAKSPVRSWVSDRGYVRGTGLREHLTKSIERPQPEGPAPKSFKIVLRTAQIHQRFIATRYAAFVRLERRGVRGRLLGFESNKLER
jgi:hypothetical protein